MEHLLKSYKFVSKANVPKAVFIAFSRSSIFNHPIYYGWQNMETLEFIIYPDGRVQEKVTGIVGASCAEVTAAIEAQLGLVIHTEPTSDFFAQKQVQESTVANAQSSFSDW